MFARGIALLSAGFLLAGCGTYVPNIQEFPDDSVAGNQLVTAILTNIKCELRDSIAQFYENTRRGEKTFLDSWGIQTNVDFTIKERSELHPTADIAPVTPANAIFTLGLGLNGSSEATRTSKLRSFYTVKELHHLGPCDPRLRGGPMLMQSDLKLGEWLNTALLGRDTNTVRYSTFKNDAEVLTHEVKFEVVTGGDLTPSWKLVHATFNQGGAFVAASRDRSHNLTITVGPTEEVYIAPGRLVRVPTRAAADAALASEIGVSVANSVRRVLR